MCEVCNELREWLEERLDFARDQELRYMSSRVWDGEIQALESAISKLTELEEKCSAGEKA